jgi:hypothetical protein
MEATLFVSRFNAFFAYFSVKFKMFHNQEDSGQYGGIGPFIENYALHLIELIQEISKINDMTAYRLLEYSELIRITSSSDVWRFLVLFGIIGMNFR